MKINIIKEFLRFIKDKDLLQNGEGVVIGLSGGPDSVCLINLLYSVQEELNLKLAACHINHMLRGEAADEDERYASELCRKLKIDFYSKRVDINEYSKKNKISSEAAGREVRYEYFNQIMKKLNFNKIATAHNANDQAETILMRIMRGTGLEGLSGIPVKRDNIYIRPILFLKREEIEEYCQNINVNARIDATNLERDYSRNKVRLDILPYMKNNFNSEIVDAIDRMGTLLEDDIKYISFKVDEVYNNLCIKEQNCIKIKAEAFKYQATIINRIIRKAVKEVSGDSYDFEMKNIQDIIALAKLETSKKVDLPKGLYALNVYGDIIIKDREEAISEFASELVIQRNNLNEYMTDFGSYIFEFKVVNIEDDIEYNQNSLIKYFDYSKISDNIVIRYRQNGDTINPIGMNGNKKVKDVFIDMKIPKAERDFIPIVTFDEEIAWIVGIKMSEKFKIDKQTKDILRIRVKRKEK
jgi:tRNA(Ile)-lysidine synthase